MDKIFTTELQTNAEKGNAEAQFELGFCYYSGDGVLQDLEKGVYWFQKAADQGQKKAQFMLSISYYSGKGVLQDLEKAGYWSQKAAE